MASHIDLASDRGRTTTSTVTRVALILAAFVAAAGFAAGLHFYGNTSGPGATVADPTKKIGPADGISKNPVTIDSLDKRAEPAKK